jgi:hypothetical protein
LAAQRNLEERRRDIRKRLKPARGLPRNAGRFQRGGIFGRFTCRTVGPVKFHVAAAFAAR